MRDLPKGTVTLLFTDIEGSTHLLQQLGGQYAGVLAECRHLLRRAFQTYSGQEVDTRRAFSGLRGLRWPGCASGGTHHERWPWRAGAALADDAGPVAG